MVVTAAAPQFRIFFLSVWFLVLYFGNSFSHIINTASFESETVSPQSIKPEEMTDNMASIRQQSSRSSLAAGKRIRLHLVRHGETIANRDGILVRISFLISIAFKCLSIPLVSDPTNGWVPISHSSSFNRSSYPIRSVLCSPIAYPYIST